MPQLTPDALQPAADDDADDGLGAPPPGGAVRRLLADPAATFLVVALAAGIFLACVVPNFGGIDEPAHFYRTYQISTGRFLPLDVEDSEFSGACIPPEIVRGVVEEGLVVLQHNARLEGKTPGPTPKVSLRGIPPCPGDRSERFVTFSTFGSPVPYVPQALGVGVVRLVGGGLDAMVLATRFAALAAYVAIVWLAIRRASRSRWAFCAVGLVPVALFQASASASHDAVTIALSLLVVASAVRLADDPEIGLQRALVEALLLTLLLAACKPGYIVLSACYLLPLLGRRRREGWWPIALVPVVGVVASVLWNEAVGGLWRTDADFFGVAVDPDRQRSLLLHEPWTFLEAAVRTVGQDVWDWGKEVLTMGPSVAVWPTVVAALALLAFGLVSLQRARHEPSGLAPSQRVLLVVVFVAGCLLVLGAQYVYWSAPGADVVGGMQARFFVPLLVLVPITIGPPRARWLTPARAPVPLTVLLVPVWIALLVTISFRMY